LRLCAFAFKFSKNNMNIQFYKYQLPWKGNPGKPPREGALLKVESNGLVGYADCHPWTEFGDAPLTQQLQWLAEGKTSPLINRSLRFVQIDAEARSQKKHLFAGLEVPQNHYHLSDVHLLSKALLDQLVHDGFDLIKIKISSPDDHAILKNFSNSRIKLRLDFNSRLNKIEFLAFLKQCAFFIDMIDYFEDPFPYVPFEWQEVREQQGIKLACDKDSLQALKHPDSCDFLVVKPAIQDIALFLAQKRHPLIITSYLDHPIGQLAGLYEAAKVLKNHPQMLSACGFLTHHAYEPNAFSQAFNHNGPQLIPSMQGYGFGYDVILENLNWRRGG
jgi:o-succinylbenzoate synthase